jgi:hypothetical protein
MDRKIGIHFSVLTMEPALERVINSTLPNQAEMKSPETYLLNEAFPCLLLESRWLHTI